MTNELFEFRRQARGPQNYLALALVMTVSYLGWAQGWGLMAFLLCGPFLAMVLVRLVENEAEGFRMTQDAIEFYGADCDGAVSWFDLSGVTISGDGTGGARCELHHVGGDTWVMPATAAFSPERLSEEFRLRGIPVWRTSTSSQQFATA